MKYKIINKGSPIDYENEIHSLTNFAKKRFGFNKPPSFVMQDDPSNASKLLGKTGYYDPNTMKIHIFTTGRHPKDILRSIAHELVHHMQHDKGELDQGGYSGQGYAQKNPHLRNMERQAYEMGNLCFRDWEDGLKQEQPTIYNERRNRKMSLKDWKNKELGQNLTEKWGFKMDLGKLNEKKHKKGVPDGLKAYQEEQAAKKNKDSDKDKDSDEKENSEESSEEEGKKKKGLKNPKKADLDKDGKLSSYERNRGEAVEKAMAVQETKNGDDKNSPPRSSLEAALRKAGHSEEKIKNMSYKELDDEAARIRQNRRQTRRKK